MLTVDLQRGVAPELGHGERSPLGYERSAKPGPVVRAGCGGRPDAIGVDQPAGADPNLGQKVKRPRELNR